MSFSHDGAAAPELLLDTWLLDPDGEADTDAARRRETGYWRLSRPRREGDPGPALLPGRRCPPVPRRPRRSRRCATPTGGFDIEVSIVHPGGVSELYLGQVKGPRIDLATDAVCAPPTAKEYAAATRLYGLVDGHLLWAWDIAALGQDAAHPRLGTARACRLMTVSPFLALSGAVAAARASTTGVAAHYGNPLREQRALAAGDAIVDLSHRAVVTVTGPDRLSWLDSITSQALAHLAPGESAETLLLDPNGRIEYALRVARRRRDHLAAPRAGRTPGPRSPGSTACGSCCASRSPTAAPSSRPSARMGRRRAAGRARTAASDLVWRDPWAAVTAGGHQYATTDSHPAAGWRWSEPSWSAIGFPRSRPRSHPASCRSAGPLALEALRIAAWRPRFGDRGRREARIPHELDWLRSAVHLDKGCYRGQETVAKVHNLGHPPRRLVMLHLDGSDGVLPARATRSLLGDDRSSARSPPPACTTSSARSRSPW